MSKNRELSALIIGDESVAHRTLEQTLVDLPEWTSKVTSATPAGARRMELAQYDMILWAWPAALNDLTALIQEVKGLGFWGPVVAVVEAEDEYEAATSLNTGACDFLRIREVTQSELRRVLARFEALHRNGDHETKTVADRRSRSQEKLAITHANLEKWAAELEIANARLREVDDLKTKFLSEVSHEIRTPLAAVVSAAKIIAKHHKTKPEVVQRFSHTILSEGERLTRLINEFLDLTKIEADCVEWKEDEVDPRLLCDDVIGGLAVLALDKNITVESAIESDLPKCTADHDRLIQVLSNLLNNALKYTPESGTIVLGVRAAEGAIEFSVKDTGPGIPAADLNRVFDRFHQVRSPETAPNPPRGTGLGLCIAREIVEHYGGRIWVESTEGAGSCFKFAIPTDAAMGPLVTSEVVVDSTIPSHAARVLALIGDPDLDARIAALPVDTGIDCRSVETPAEALALLGEWRADVAVVAGAFVERHGDDLIAQIQAQGVAHVLLYSSDIGFAYVGALETSDTIARGINSFAPAAERVLVVEDDAEYRGLLEFQLKEAGYTVLTATNGKEGLEIIRAGKADAVLLDLIMPVLDGMSVLETLQSEGIDVPVAVLTGMDDARVAVAARELGARSVFRKDSAEEAPYRTVITRIQRVLASVLPIGVIRSGDAFSLHR